MKFLKQITLATICITFLCAYSVQTFSQSLNPCDPSKYPPPLMPAYCLGSGSGADSTTEGSTESDTELRSTKEIELRAPFDKSKSVIRTDKGAIDILQQYVSQIFKFGFALVTIFAVIMMMYAGYEYMLAGGESGKVDTAKSRVAQTLLGLVFLGGGAFLLHLVNPNFFLL